LKARVSVESKKKKRNSLLFLARSTKGMDDTGIEPGTSRMLSACDNQLHQTPNFLKKVEKLGSARVILLSQIFIFKQGVSRSR
jgi:hypothetical protein